MNVALKIDQRHLEDTRTPAFVGVLGAVALPVVGVGVGVAQIVRGMANTPEAIREQQKGKSWDQVCPQLAS